MVKLRKEERKMLNGANNALISNLKGRISKVLNIGASTLPLEERSGLEGIYDAIDTLLCSNKDQSDVKLFKDELLLHSKFLHDTQKNYIKEHILPIVKKVSTGKWSGTDE
jgi:hypothetical protein